MYYIFIYKNYRNITIWQDIPADPEYIKLVEIPVYNDKSVSYCFKTSKVEILAYTERSNISHIQLIDTVETLEQAREVVLFEALTI